MRRKILSAAAFVLTAVIALSLCSCYSEPADLDRELSREYVESSKNKSWYATAKTDGDIEAVLAFIYSDEYFAEEFGQTFELTSRDDVGSSAEGKQFGWLWESHGTVWVVFEKRKFEFTVSKGYWDSKWHVDNYKEVKYDG